jgi:peptidoglycan/LPS O-acetylase OafA/YrhL
MPELPVSGKYLPELDGVRAIAIGMVLIVHCVIVPKQGLIAWVLRQTLLNGGYGVDLFFVLSGYLITSILLRAKPRPHYFRNFYARRFLRIFPLYYAIILLLAACSRWLPFGPMDPVWPYVLYVSNLSMVFTLREWVPLGHTWSLAIEEQFYLVFPIMVLWTGRVRLRFLLWSVILVTPLIRVITSTQLFPAASAFATFCRLDVLAMGALIALEFDGRTEISDRAARTLRLAFFSFAAASIILWLTKQFDFRKVFFNAAGLTIIDVTAALFLCVVLTAPGKWLAGMLRQPAAVAMGRISYGLYLIHYPVLKIVQAKVVARTADTWIRTAAIAATTLSATIVLAILSWYLFERPVLRLKKRFYEPGEGAARVETAMIETPVALSLESESSLPG